MAGRRSPQSPSLSQLTSQPETIPSCHRRSRHAKFQPQLGRHPITLDTVLSRAVEILYAPVGTTEVVMLSVKAGCYYGLNAVAVRIWDLLECPRTIASLCERLCEEFEVDATTCQAEVLTFANDLVDNGIVHATAA
jgi:Coenzyme PQQ synthesis protein D (PqqD)